LQQVFIFVAQNLRTPMKRKTLYLLLACAVFFASCKKEIDLQSSNPEGQQLASVVVPRDGDNDPRDGEGELICPEKTVALISGQHTTAGEVKVTSNDTIITVTFTTTGDFKIKATHLYVGTCEGVPVSRKGNAVPGRFPYKATHNNVTTYTYTIPVSAIGLNNCGCIAAHAELVRVNSNGCGYNTSTGWGEGVPVTSTQSNWAMKFDYCAEPCYSDPFAGL
jgi:hypothetical protein